MAAQTQTPCCSRTTETLAMTGALKAAQGGTKHQQPGYNRQAAVRAGLSPKNGHFFNVVLQYSHK